MTQDQTCKTQQCQQAIDVGLKIWWSPAQDEYGGIKHQQRHYHCLFGTECGTITLEDEQRLFVAKQYGGVAR